LSLKGWKFYLLLKKYFWRAQFFDISLEWKCWKSLTPKNFLQFFFPFLFLLCLFLFFWVIICLSGSQDQLLNLNIMIPFSKRFVPSFESSKWLVSWFNSCTDSNKMVSPWVQVIRT
jgi:hypothetical protein